MNSHESLIIGEVDEEGREDVLGKDEMSWQCCSEIPRLSP